MKPFTTIAAAIFGLLAVIHGYRALVGFQVTVGTTVIGLEASWIGLAIAIVMCAGLVREAGR